MGRPPTNPSITRPCCGGPDVAEHNLATAQQAVDAINAQVEAQQAQIAFLTGLKLDGAGATAESLTQIADMIQTKVLAARQAAQTAQQGLPVSNDGVTKAQDALSRAQAALDALSRPDDSYTALSVALTTTADKGHLTVTHFMYDASWAPVYDMALDRKAPKLTVDRGVLVSQSTGEDWSAVDLTLSTAQPGTQSEPSALYPDRKSIADPQPEAKAADGMADAMGEAVMAAPAVVATASMSYQGDTVVYHYPTAVDVASGVENLRLALDTLAFAPEVEARAVPRYDRTAFLMAKLTNTAPELLLPGTAYLSRDGALVGSTRICCDQWRAITHAVRRSPRPDVALLNQCH